MDKLIDDIIELILDNIECYHAVEHEEDGTHMSVEYSPKDEKSLRDKIVALIKKPQVTEEWIEKRAFRLFARLLNINGAFLEAEGMRNAIKDFIRSLVESITSLQEVDKGDR